MKKPFWEKVFIIIVLAAALAISMLVIDLAFGLSDMFSGFYAGRGWSRP